MTKPSVKIVADSISKDSKIRLTTVQIVAHRFIIPELNTHRVFSRNYSSSRAIPVQKLIDQVRSDPAIPVSWGLNKPGMQADDEAPDVIRNLAIDEWITSAKKAADSAESLMKYGIHKQIVNRVLEPYVWIHGIITSTEWNNFFMQRCHKDAQPEIQYLANLIRDELWKSSPIELVNGEWHLPYITQTDKDTLKTNDRYILQKISAARCARVSYLKHDGTKPSIQDDLVLFDKLVGGDICHYSPLEHQATPDLCNKYNDWYASKLHGNLYGWKQYRKLHELITQ